MFAWPWDSGDYFLTRFLLQRAMAFCYLVAFLIAVNQFCALAGEKGLSPVHHVFRDRGFWDSPGLFHFFRSDAIFQAAAWAGTLLALFALSGYSEKFGFAVSLVTWSALWVLYLSFVNAGGEFYGFGWELLLLEAGFLTIFLGPQHVAPPVLVIWLFRWLLFRLMFGAGMIKWRGDECWRNLTCMDYHYETQPLPNAFSWSLHHLPKGIHRIETAFTLFVEIAVPFGFLFPNRVAWVAGLITIVFQLFIILSGNLAWLNFFTIALCIPCFDDRALAWLSGLVTKGELLTPVAHQYGVYALTALVVALSYRPAKNLLSSRQVMISSYDPFHLVNTYGMFGGITTERREVVIEGTSSAKIDADTVWKEYDFKAKPGDPKRAPPFIAPYYYKLDWQMWFAAMSPYWEHPWVLNLAGKLLEGDRATLSLMAKNPFPEKPPRFLRMEWYEYRFTKPGDPSGNWWSRTRVEEYLDPVSLDNPRFREALSQIRSE